MLNSADMQLTYSNVYGHIVAPQGLEYVLQALKPIVKSVAINESFFNLVKTLRIRTDEADMESTQLENNRHLLNGFVANVNFVETMSEVLTKANIEHSFEFYDNKQNLIYIVKEALLHEISPVHTANVKYDVTVSINVDSHVVSLCMQLTNRTIAELSKQENILNIKKT